VLVTLTVTELDTVEPSRGVTITRGPAIGVAVGPGVAVILGVGVLLAVAVGFGVWVGTPLLTEIVTEAVAVTTPVVCRCAETVRRWDPLDTVAEFHEITW
jgi:hypothetical protein